MSNTQRKIEGEWLHLLLVGVLLFGLLSGAGPPANAQEATVSRNYVIGPEDVLEIKVWGHDDLSRQVTVAADGTFSFPLIGRLRAAGLTVKQLEQELAALLDKDYIVNPQVTITVTAFKSKKVFVLGEVHRPGSYYLSKDDTVLEVLSKAGGVTDQAGREVVIVRPAAGAGASQPARLDNPNSDLIRVDVQALMAGDVSKNVVVQNNDTIYVPKSSVFSVFGEVRKPGSYPLEKPLTVLEALSIAGGPTQDADPQKLELLRKEGDEQRKIILNLKDLLNATDEGEQKLLIQDGDVLYQPRAEFFFVMGEVNKPGTYKLEQDMTVTKAISVAGGFTERASKKKVQIVREQNGKQVKHRAKPNELVQPQDIVEVPKSFF
jgi:polysaccharide biosynthesis/export protein